MPDQKKPSFWEKAKNIGKSVGKMTLASAGMAVSAISGILLTTAGYIADAAMVAPAATLVLGAALVALGGLALALSGDEGSALESSLSLATNMLQIAGSFAILTSQKAIIQSELKNFNKTPDTITCSRGNYIGTRGPSLGATSSP